MFVVSVSSVSLETVAVLTTDWFMSGVAVIGSPTVTVKVMTVDSPCSRLGRVQLIVRSVEPEQSQPSSD